MQAATTQSPPPVAQVGDVLRVHLFKPWAIKTPSKPFIGLGRNGDEAPELDEEALTRWGNAIPRVVQLRLVQGMTVQISGISQELTEKHGLAMTERAHVVNQEDKGLTFELRSGFRLRLTDLSIGTEIRVESPMLIEL